MVIKIDLAKVVNALIQSVFKYFSNVEKLPSHPNVKSIKIVSREETGLVFEQESSLIGKKIRSTNRVVLYPDQNIIETEVIEGDGKGSKTTTTTFSGANDSTQIKVEGDLHLGRLERLFSKAAKSTAEKLLNEDVKIIESGLSE